MSSSLATLLLAALLAGIHGSDVTLHSYPKGHFVEIVAVTFPSTTSRCFLVTPAETEIDLRDDNLNAKYEFRTNTLSGCIVRINDLDKNDEGLWSLHAVTSGGDIVEHAEITIERSESSEEKSEDSKENVSEETSASSKETSKQETTEASSELPDSSTENSQEDTNTSVDSSNPQPESSGRSESSEDKSEEHSKENVSEETSASSKEASKQESAEASSELPDSSTDNSQEDTSVDSSNPQPESSESEEVIETWLNDQSFRTRTGLTVDINIPRIPQTEECTFTAPDGTSAGVGESMPGVTSHGRSDYVSCRIVVGPMESSLIGQWTLCGAYFLDGVQHKRCLRANIAWRNAANPDTVWQTTIQPKFDHVVHFGGTLSPAVRGSGTVASCHLVTPDHEDLLVTRDSEYEHISLVQNTDSACSISIGPLAEAHLGDWEIYGTFDSALWGFNEVRLPMNLDVYNRDHPYDQAYNITELNPTQHVVNLGSTIQVDVTSTGAVDVCSFTMPSGQPYFSTEPGMPSGVAFVNDNRISCRLSIGPITETMLGTWLLIGKFSNRDIYTERRLTFTIIQEDPSNPILEDRRIEYLTEQNFDTNIGASHRVVIATQWNILQTCHIRTPDGLQYTIMEGFDIPGIKVETASNIACGVTVEVAEELIGNWTLISREIRSSELIERHLAFNIHVEEFVDALPNEITITEGNALHVRLASPTGMHSSCRLLGPDGEQSPLASRDERYEEACGFVVTSIDADHQGTWHIVYGTTVIYKAPVVVNINGRLPVDTLQLTWVEHSPISQTMGPEDAVYCRVLSPQKTVAFDDFGRCRVDLDVVLIEEHAGVWTMTVGLTGRIVTEEHKFAVTVKEAEAKPEVSTAVWQDKPIVELTCGVISEEEKTGCLFRDPQGKVLVASQGVKEGRYAFHVNQSSSESGFHYSCGLQISDPVTSDLGLWRCDLESSEDIYYGFLSVLCPWAMQDPIIAASVIAEPVLTAQAPAVAERAATLLCAARAPLRYCYFRAPNGTVYNLAPGMSSPTAQYVGAGLDAGECGARLQLASADAGNWSCHAGFRGRAEQRRDIDVFVEDEFTLWSSRESARLVVEGQVGGRRALDYCRFVRSDGFGFTSDSMPFPYADESDLERGLCRMRVAVSELDLHPWTLVAKVRGRDGEMARVTGHNWPAVPVYRYNAMYLWLPVMSALTVTLMALVALAPARNRRWAAARASSLRSSLRLPSLRKKPLASPDA